jgi:hypothetical protein
LAYWWQGISSCLFYRQWQQSPTAGSSWNQLSFLLSLPQPWESHFVLAHFICGPFCKRPPSSSLSLGLLSDPLKDVSCFFPVTDDPAAEPSDFWRDSRPLCRGSPRCTSGPGGVRWLLRIFWDYWNRPFWQLFDSLFHWCLTRS